MMNKGLYSSNSQEWGTPQAFFDRLNAEFHFNLDVCATPKNAKCERYFDAERDGLTSHWAGRVFCNPPYKGIADWVKKGYESVHGGGYGEGRRHVDPRQN